MKNFIGIDLGTTNSAICSYDGSATHIWKNPDQNDVTPSVIYIDQRSKFVGRRAYDKIPVSDGNVAKEFKRLMGTNTPIHLSAVNLTLTPEQCSAEILKELFGYLPEEIRNDPETGTVITVPAAFNQMQKDATMSAAKMAGIGNVALMQEPVAAVMSVMRANRSDGMFLIYDLGGGTLDIAIAESTDGRVNLLAHGGIEMCGGRDFDRVLVAKTVLPWLREHFDLPDDLPNNPQYKTLIGLATWSTEKAKIELSAREETRIVLSETEVRIKDRKGLEVYLDIELQRKTFDNHIANWITESIDAARETLSKAGLSSQDLERIVFVGGPTYYKPLRDKVAVGLGIPGSMDVNPMAAVAEGASVFAESIDWSSERHERKNTRGQISIEGTLNFTVRYSSRTPSDKAKIFVQLEGDVTDGAEFQVTNLDTGWSSGHIPLKSGTTLDVSLPKTGENVFKIFVFDSVGGPIRIKEDKLTITRTAATIDGIPASHSIGIEVLDKMGGIPTLDYLVQAGDSLPKKGTKTFRSVELLKAGSSGSINFKLWEGDIKDPISDNRLIGVLRISGSDFDDAVIPAGANLECEFEVLDSGNIILEISVPSISRAFPSGRNFYSRQEGQLDYSSASGIIIDEGQKTLDRVDKISEVVNDPMLDKARKRLESVVSIDPQEVDPEMVKKADNDVHDVRKLLYQIRREHLKEIRQIELNVVTSFFDKYVRAIARPSEISMFDTLSKTAQRSIDKNDMSFEHQLEELKVRNFGILWRQDWFVIDRFKGMVDSPHLFIDKSRFEELTRIGSQYLRDDDIDKLRTVVAQLEMIRIGDSNSNELFDEANIIRG